MIKKRRALVYPLYFLLLFLMPLVSAGPVQQSSDVIRSVIDAAVGVFGPVFAVILGDPGTGEFFFTKILLFILLTIMIAFILGRVPQFSGRRGLVFIIALIIAILGVRFIGEDSILAGVLLPYGTLAVAILIILPSAILFLGVYASDIGGLGRRAVLVVWTIVLIGLWSYKFDSMHPLMNKIYWAIIIVFALMIMFLDRGMKGFFATHELHRFRGSARRSAAARLQAEYLNIINVDTPEARNRRREIEDNLRRLGATITV